MKLLTQDVASGFALGREELLEAVEAAIFELSTHFGLPLDPERRPGLTTICQHVEASRRNIAAAREAALKRAEDELARFSRPDTQAAALIAEKARIRTWQREQDRPRPRITNPRLRNG